MLPLQRARLGWARAWARGHQALGQKSKAVVQRPSGRGPEVIRPWARGQKRWARGHQAVGQRSSGLGPEVIKPWARGHQALSQRSSGLGSEASRPQARGHHASGQRSSSRRPTAAEYVPRRSAKQLNIFLLSVIQHLDFHFLNPPSS